VRPQLVCAITKSDCKSPGAVAPTHCTARGTKVPVEAQAHVLNSSPSRPLQFDWVAAEYRQFCDVGG
jgi:hypothetical protein